MHRGGNLEFNLCLERQRVKTILCRLNMCPVLTVTIWLKTATKGLRRRWDEVARVEVSCCVVVNCSRVADNALHDVIICGVVRAMTREWNGCCCCCCWSKRIDAAQPDRASCVVAVVKPALIFRLSINQPAVLFTLNADNNEYHTIEKYRI